MQIIHCLFVLNTITILLFSAGEEDEAVNDLVVLGLCISCFIGKRGAEFCRVTKGHMDDRASTCAECESKGATVTHCRQELHHKENNAANLIQCIPTDDIPPCCMELTIPKVECYSSGDSKGKPTTKSVIGYMIPYREELWKSWMNQFILQSRCQFTIRTGAQENQNTS